MRKTGNYCAVFLVVGCVFMSSCETNLSNSRDSQMVKLFAKNAIEDAYFAKTKLKLNIRLENLRLQVSDFGLSEVVYVVLNVSPPDIGVDSDLVIVSLEKSQRRLRLISVTSLRKIGDAQPSEPVVLADPKTGNFDEIDVFSKPETEGTK